MAARACAWSGRGNGRKKRQGPTSHAERMGEGEAVWIAGSGNGTQGGIVHERTDRCMRQEKPQTSFFRLVSARYEKGSIALTSNKHVRDWPEIFAGDEILTTANLDPLLHYVHLVHIDGLLQPRPRPLHPRRTEEKRRKCLSTSLKLNLYVVSKYDDLAAAGGSRDGFSPNLRGV
jgi:hypothetical protein